MIEHQPTWSGGQYRTVDQVVILPDGADAKGWYANAQRFRVKVLDAMPR